MSELFDDNDEEKTLMVDEDLIEAEHEIVNIRKRPTSDARKRLEALMEEKRLRDELEDFSDDF